MTLHYEDAGLRLWHGSNLDILRADALGYPHEFGYHADRLIPDATYDSIVTDPPYELGFMGKGWDSSGIAYDVDLWRECLRVLKPGGHLLAFGGSRTWHRMAVAIEDAGFEMRDSIAWLYGSGFPKSMNVAKAIASGTGRPEDIRRLNMGDAYEPSGRGRVNYDNGGGSKMNGAPLVDVDLPEAAQEWEGWGTALKPAFEPIVVARKPFRGTVAANVLAYGTGALNIDATRIPTGDNLTGGHGTAGQQMSDGWSRPWMSDPKAVAANAARARVAQAKAEELGRHPANVILDSSQAAALDAQTGVLTSGKLAAHHARAPKGAGILGAYGATEGERGYGDTGGASRFFTTIQEEPCAPSTATATNPTATSATSATPAPSGTERPAPAAGDGGDTRFPTFRYEAKAPTSERPNVEGTVHATVKPLALIRWLVRLVTRPGGRVLDLYAGSGTTGEAALLEGMEVDLIELEEDHLPLILARVRKPLHVGLFPGWEEAS